MKTLGFMLIFFFNMVSGLHANDIESQDIQTSRPELQQTKNSIAVGVNNVLSTTATGLSRTFNPAISVNGLFLATYRSIENDNLDAETKTGMKIQEMEIQFTASVDAFFKANLILSMEEVDAIEIEEGYVDVLIMNNLSMRAGKFYAGFGRHNRLHTHQFPFIEAPLVNQEVFGEEGLNETGLSFNYLIPLPWYSEFVLQFLEGDNEALLHAPLNDDFAYLTNWKNFWEVGDDTTLELGASFLTGNNETGGSLSVSQALGADITLKWKPATRSSSQSAVWQTEFIYSSKEKGPNQAKEEKAGIYSFLQYQFTKTWWAQARYDFLDYLQPEMEGGSSRWSALLAYVPSEFSSIRLQYNYLDEAEGISDEHQVLLQLNFTLGSHPAHLY